MNALKRFKGISKQLPPKFSAKKINGVPMYKLARRGQQFERKTQMINIFNIELLKYEFPKFQIKVLCSKGTYMRTLGVDIGKSLNQAVSMCELKRTKFGSLTLDETITLTKLKNLDKKKPSKEGFFLITKNSSLDSYFFPDKASLTD